MRLPAALLLLAFLPLAACGPDVTINPHGVFVCAAATDCDDDNDCTTDTCEAKVCKFTWKADGVACTDGDGAKGTCAAGVCSP